MIKSLRKLKYSLVSDKRVAIIKLEGIIIDIPNAPVATKILESIQEVKDKNIKAVVFRINSPGGTVGATQEIYYALKKLKEEGITVVTSMADVAASGGIYIAMAGDKVVSLPGTVTGSIGVIIKNRIIKDLYKKVGVDQDLVKSGKFKDILSESKHFSDEERQILQGMIDDTYSQFIETVSKNRNIDIETVKTFADGRIFTGNQAKELGLIDELGTLEDAVNLAAKLAGIEQKPVIFDLSPKKGLLQRITGNCLTELLDNFALGSASGIPLWLMPGGLI